MSGLSPFTWLLLVWAAVSTVFLILMIYRSLVSMREDDQLFLNPAETALEEAQKEIQGRLSRVTPYTKGFGYASAGLAVVIVGFWIYQGISQFNSP
jgi:hypothetical protein